MLRYSQVFGGLELVLTNEPDVALRDSAVAILPELLVVVRARSFRWRKDGFFKGLVVSVA